MNDAQTHEADWPVDPRLERDPLLAVIEEAWQSGILVEVEQTS